MSVEAALCGEVLLKKLEAKRIGAGERDFVFIQNNGENPVRVAPDAAKLPAGGLRLAPGQAVWFDGRINWWGVDEVADQVSGAAVNYVETYR